MAELPTGSRALYRIMTEKSVLGFGKYADIVVGDVLKIDPDYIVWAYYTLSMVSFRADILEALGVSPIEKPGVSEDSFREWQRKRSAQYTKEERDHYFWGIQRVQNKIAKRKLCEAKRATSYTKGQLQALNHGHKLNK